MMRKLRGFFSGVMLPILCIILAVILGLLMISYKKAMEAKAKELTEQALASSTDISSVTDSDLAGYVESESETETAVAEEETEESKEITALIDKYEGISCRGDGFIEYGSAASNGYPAKLQNILVESGRDIEVLDFTLDTAGSLTQLSYAGVSSEEIQAYISAHSAAGFQSSKELQIRDLSAYDLTRTDTDYLPVIALGCYGGWGNDLTQLIEQQHKILDTYDDPEEYIILGYYPDGYYDTASYDTAMQEEWGDHYLALNSEMTVAAMSDQGRTEIATAIYNWMIDNGYLEQTGMGNTD